MKARIGCIFLVLLLLPDLVNPQGKPEKEKIRIGYAARVVAHSIPYLAAQAGLFHEEGISVEVVQTAGSVAPMALIAGEVDFSIMSAFLLIPVSVQSGDVVMLGAFGRYATMTLISRSEIRTAEELRGKTIGLQRPGDATEINARFALRHLGLDPSRDVSFLYLGSNELMWPALQTRRIAATMLQPPWTLLARKSGMNFLIDLSDLKIEYQGSTLASRRSFIRNNPNLTRRVLRAIVRGVHFFYSRKEESLRILGKFLATDNAEALEESYRYAKFPPKPYATDSAVQATLNHLAERDTRFAQRKPAEFIDSGPLSELDRSGFIDRLYAGQR
jgi:ABC-type nitrate/sulfonate/bicarbonate transport system substrate-binding protein